MLHFLSPTSTTTFFLCYLTPPTLDSIAEEFLPLFAPLLLRPLLSLLEYFLFFEGNVVVVIFVYCDYPLMVYLEDEENGDCVREEIEGTVEEERVCGVYGVGGQSVVGVEAVVLVFSGVVVEESEEI